MGVQAEADLAAARISALHDKELTSMFLDDLLRLQSVIAAAHGLCQHLIRYGGGSLVGLASLLADTQHAILDPDSSYRSTNVIKTTTSRDTPS